MFWSSILRVWSLENTFSTTSIAARFFLKDVCMYVKSWRVDKTCEERKRERVQYSQWHRSVFGFPSIGECVCLFCRGAINYVHVKNFPRHKSEKRSNIVGMKRMHKRSPCQPGGEGEDPVWTDSRKHQWIEEPVKWGCCKRRENPCYWLPP